MLSFATHKIRRMEEATKLAKVTVANAGINEVSVGGKKNQNLSLVLFKNKTPGKNNLEVVKCLSLSQAITDFKHYCCFLHLDEETLSKKIRQVLPRDKSFISFPLLLSRRQMRQNWPGRCCCTARSAIKKVPATFLEWHSGLKSISPIFNRPIM